MRGMMRLAIMGVPGAQGGTAALPTEITDDFSTDSGLWLDGDLQPAAITVADGRAIWTPTLGNEINATANAAADPLGIEANATTGWTGVSCTLATSEDAAAGTYSLHAHTPTNTFSRIRKYLTAASGEELRISCAAKQTTSTTVLIGLRMSDCSPAADIPTTTTWQPYLFTRRTTATTLTLDAHFRGAAGNTGYLDNVSIRPIVAASTRRMRQIYYPSVISCKLRRSAHTQAGVEYYKDTNNYIRIYDDGEGSVVILKRVAGVITQVASATVTYAADATWTITPNTSFDGFSVTVGANSPAALQGVSVADFAGDLGPWYVALYSTLGDSIDSDAFSSFSAQAVAGASPF